MKHKPSPFISISGLMAGIIAVIMLLLVMSALQVFAVKAEQEAYIAAQEAEKRNIVAEALGEIRKEVEKNGASDAIIVGSSGILLRDNSFERGSACIDSSVKVVLSDIVAPILVKILKNPDLNIGVQFEGHTDAKEVKGHVFACAHFDDNYSLSAGRAREARRVVLHAVNNDRSISKKISVVGYGPDKLINPDPDASENRRVEISLVPEKN